jgi:hypothetical protein
VADLAVFGAIRHDTQDECLHVGNNVILARSITPAIQRLSVSRSSSSVKTTDTETTPQTSKQRYYSPAGEDDGASGVTAHAERMSCGDCASLPQSTLWPSDALVGLRSGR